MKAVIVDINKKYAAVLSDDGRITKVLNRNYAIGEMIDVKKTNNFLSGKKAKIAIAAAAFLMICGLGSFTYLYPSTYVSVDVNPSVEFTLNMFDRVLSVKGVNDDGTEIVKELSLSNLSNKKIDEAIELTIDEIANQGYFDGDIENNIVITTSAKDLKRANELAEELKDISDEKCKEHEYNTEVTAEGVGRDRVKKAKELGLTPGKLNLIEKLKASSADPDSINIEDWKNKPVKEIQEAVKINRIMSSLTEEQLQLIKPASDELEATVGVAKETFNTAFEAIKTSYEQKVEAAKTEITDAKQLKAKLNELRTAFISERRTALDQLSSVVKAAKEKFLADTQSFEIDAELLENYAKCIINKDLDVKEGYKDILDMFRVEDNDKKQGEKNDDKSNGTQNGKSDKDKENDKDKKDNKKPQQSTSEPSSTSDTESLVTSDVDDDDDNDDNDDIEEANSKADKNDKGNSNKDKGKPDTGKKGK